MKALGREFDLSAGLAVYDTNAGAGTGKRVNISRAGGLAIVLFKAAGTGTDVPVLTLKEHNAASSGTSQNLARITEVWGKSATTLAGTETWTQVVSQAAAATATLTGEATKQGIYVIEVEGTWLSDGFSYVSVDVADTGAAGAQWAGVLYILRDLEVQRDPSKMVASLR